MPRPGPGMVGGMANLVGRARRTEPGNHELTGPLHAVGAEVGRPALESHEDVPALCGVPVRVIPVEDVPDDAGLCQACQYGE